jgi:hypothetical protein
MAVSSVPNSRADVIFSDEQRERVLVEGAGKEVSGIYKRIDTHDNVGKYHMKSSDNWSGFFLLRCALQDGTKHWCITASLTPNVNGTLFTAPQSTEDPDYPPSMGWTRPGSSGAQLSPTVTVMSLRKPCVLPTVSVAKPVTTTYEKILFAEEFSDVQFICDDGVIIPAHRCILAAASTYFRAAFSGPWQENQSGFLKTSHPAHIIKAMLTLIYTGEISSNLVEEEPLAFMSVASEYDLEWLKMLVEPKLHPIAW